MRAFSLDRGDHRQHPEWSASAAIWKDSTLPSTVNVPVLSKPTARTPPSRLEGFAALDEDTTALLGDARQHRGRRGDREGARRLLPAP